MIFLDLVFSIFFVSKSFKNQLIEDNSSCSLGQICMLELSSFSLCNNFLCDVSKYLLSAQILYLFI